MPIYTFKLRADYGSSTDDTGVGLPNAEAAHDYACTVVRELMFRREPKTRHWCLDVFEEADGKIFEVPFVQLDPTLNCLSAESRGLVELACQRRRAVRDILDTLSATQRESAALIARSRGKFYLAAIEGEKVIRGHT
jgi:hypothetical protein